MRLLRPLPPRGRAEQSEFLGERRVVVPLAIGERLLCERRSGAAADWRRDERSEVLGERRVVVPLAIGGGISDAHTANDAATMPACARREERRRRQLPARLREPSLKKRAIRRGNPDRPRGCW
jgi:hypothetical protein